MVAGARCAGCMCVQWYAAKVLALYHTLIVYLCSDQVNHKRGPGAQDPSAVCNINTIHMTSQHTYLTFMERTLLGSLDTF